ncbi:MAG: hypothetical protein F6K11_06610 [Leptolyngbya sp. SIO3F4]|nr:hypothetical protein [Leptolyngbya sp. SIO3F4]
MVITAARSSFIGKLSLLVGVALTISACGGGGGGGGSSDNSSETSATTVSVTESDQLVLEIQPIQVCDDNGIVCAQVEFFEAVADKIWAQANIDITFLPLNQLHDSTYLTTDANEFADLSFSGGAGAFGRHPDSTRTQGPINLWFVDVIETSTGLVQFGNAWIGLNGVLVSDDVFTFNNGAGRIDVISHEIGHNLGLRHSTFGAGPANNVMTGGSSRTIPDSIDDIFPDGEGLSQLTSAQIAEARSSGFLIGSEADNIVPVLSADAIPVPLPGESLAGGVLPVASLAVPIDVPERAPSPLTWLLLLPLGQRVYRRISC